MHVYRIILRREQSAERRYEMVMFLILVTLILLIVHPDIVFLQYAEHFIAIIFLLHMGRANTVIFYIVIFNCGLYYSSSVIVHDFTVT